MSSPPHEHTDVTLNSHWSLSTIIEALGDGFLVHDGSGQILYANPEAARMLGFESPEALLATQSAELMGRLHFLDERGKPLPPEQLPGPLALRGLRPPTAEARLRLATTGQESWMTVTATPFLDEQEKVEQVVIALHDVTEQRRTTRAMRLLAEASALLSASLDTHATLQAVAKLAVPELADWCALHLLEEDGTYLLVAVAHQDHGRAELMHELQRRFPARPDSPAVRVLQTGKPIVLEQITDEHLQIAAHDEEHLRLLRALGFQTSVTVPLIAQGRPLGALTLASAESHRRFDSVALSLAMELAGRAALAIDNTRLFQQAQLALWKKNEEARISYTLRRLGSSFASELEPSRLLQHITDEAAVITGATFGAFLPNGVTEWSELSLRDTLSGAPPESFLELSRRQARELFSPSPHGNRVLRLDDVRRDVRESSPIRSFLAVSLVSRSDVVLGGLFFGHPEVGAFTEEHAQVAVGIAAQAAVALDNARLFQQLRNAEEKSRQNEEESRRSEERLRLALSAARMGDFEMDLHTRQSAISPSVEAILGLPTGTYDGTFETYLRHVHPDDRRGALERIQHQQESGENSAALVRVLRLDGSVRWIETHSRVVRDEAGQPLKRLGVVVDVTDRKEAEERIRREEEKLHLALDAGKMGYFELDLTQGEAFLSPRFEAMSGVTPGSGVNSHAAFLNLVHPEDRQEFISRLEHLVASGAKEELLAFRVIHPDGAVRWIEGYHKVLRDSARRPSTIIGIGYDATERRQAEEQLRRSEERFRLALQAGRMGHYDIDMVTLHMTFSPAMEALHGIRVGTFDGTLEHFGRTLHPEDRERVRSQVDRLLDENRTDHHVYYRVVHPHGAVRWINSRGTLFRDPAGKALRLLGVAMDATEQIEAEERARRLAGEQAARAEAEAAQRWIAAILDSISEPLFALDRAGRLHFANRPAKELVSTLPSLLPRYESVLHEGAPVDLEAQLPDGRWYELRARPFAQGMSLYLHDLTAQKREEEAQLRLAHYEALRANVSTALSGEGQLVDVLQRCTEALVRHLGVDLARIWTVDAQENTLNLKGSAGHIAADERFARLPLADVRDSLLGDGRPFLTNDLRSSRFTHEDQALRESFTAYARYPLIIRDQFIGVVAMLSTRPMPEDMMPALSAIADVLAQGIQRRRTEQALAERAAELARSNAELEQFAYVASHDLQEPLRMVASFTELLARRYQGQLDERGDRYINFAVDGVTRMQRLIQDLLAFSRVGTHGKPLLSTDSQLVLQHTLSNLEVAIAEAGAHITADPLPTVLADEVQLEQLFQNLLSNALKFRIPGTPPSIHLSARQDGDEWIFSVRDNGIGIEPQYFERIFIIFQRLHGKARYPGTGIGLAICKKIVERHGGRIWVESSGGQGSTFLFTLTASR